MSKLFYDPFDHQLDAIKAIFEFFENKKGNPLVVAPGGSGKTVTIAEFCRQVKEAWPDQKILILCDDQEINLQNFNTIQNQNPDQTIGLYSSSLKSKTIEDITIGQIQSIYNKTELFKHFNIIIVDEAHDVPYNTGKKKSRYRMFLDELNKPTIGFTATAFRLGTGFLHLGKGRYFTDIIHETKISTLQELDPPRLCQITSKAPKKQLDASQIKKQAGDFILKELSLAFDKDEITTEIVQDLIQLKETRKKWLVYAIDIEHCNHICDTLNLFGIKSRVVHSKTGIDRKGVIDNFRNTNDYQAIVSVAMLTKGVDIPEVDLIAILRSTSSPVLHCQIILRGMRVAPGKIDCLIRDYAGNLLRNGPIDNPILRLKGEGNGQAVLKVCDECQEVVPIAVRVCPKCGTEFQFKHNLKLSASDKNVISEPSWYSVTEMEYDYYVGTRGIPMLLAIHRCGVRSFIKVVSIEHGGRATYLAKYWWERRSDVQFPKKVKEAMEHTEKLRKPKRIFVLDVGKYPEIKETEF